MALTLTTPALVTRREAVDVTQNAQVLRNVSAADSTLDLSPEAWRTFDKILVPRYSLAEIRIFGNAAVQTLGFSIVAWPMPSVLNPYTGGFGQVKYKGTATTPTTGQCTGHPANMNPVTGAADASDSWFEIDKTPTPAFAMGDNYVAGVPAVADEKDNFGKFFLVDLTGSYALTVHLNTVPGKCIVGVRIIM